MAEPEHTPLPWYATCADGALKIRGPADAKRYKQREVCRCYGRESDAEFIVRACNAHDDLVAALEAALQHLGSAVQEEEYEEREGPALRLNDIIVVALAKARGQS